jgi:predicted permease
MRVFDKLQLRIRSVFRWRRVEAELQDELQFHLEQLVKEKAAAGLPPIEARQEALRAMGGIAQFQEDCRAMRGVNFWEDLLRDVGYAGRSFTRTPVFFLSAIVILAIGIGVNNAVFTVVRSVVLNPLPYPDANQLVLVWKAVGEEPDKHSGVAPADFLELQEQAHSFQSIAAFTHTSFDVGGVDEPYRVLADRVSANFFATLGVRPEYGRDFTADDDQPVAEHVAILSHGLWQTRFNGRLDTIGGNVFLNNERYAIVGVMPSHFAFSESGNPAEAPELWTALRFTDERTQRGSGYMRILGRLKGGVTQAAVRAELGSVTRQFAGAQPRTYGSEFLTAIPLLESVIGGVRQLLLVLWGAVICVLLIMCTNLANMLLVRATGRVKELVVRTSLGASHWRLTRQLLTENLALGLCGGALGLAVAFTLIRSIPSMGFTDLPRLHEISMDGWVVTFSLVLAALTGLFFGGLPAWKISQMDPQQSMQTASRATGGRRANALRAIFGAVQIALALMLVTGAGLCLHSFAILQKADLGFQPENVVSFQLPLPKEVQGATRATTFYREVAERIRQLPHVRSVGMITYLPLRGNAFGWRFLIRGQETPTGIPIPSAEYRVVSGDLFSALRIPIRLGRGFHEHDLPDSLPVAIVNETMARRYWPGENPIGKQLRLGGPPSMFPWLTVVGVAGDVRYGKVEAAPEPTIYQCLAQTRGPSLSVVVRSDGNPMGALGLIRSQIREVDRSVPLLDVREMNYFVSIAFAQRRLVLAVLSTFALIALFLATFGIYSVVSYSVAQRTQEIGLRVALGAPEGSILKLVLVQGMWISMAGILAGAMGNLALGKAISTLLYKVEPTDPITIGAVSILLSLVTVMACYFPARRALRIDPMIALRSE